MYVYVCVYRCMNVHLHRCRYVFTNVRTFHTHVCMHLHFTHMYVCTYISHTCIYIWPYISHTCMYLCMYVCLYVHFKHMNPMYASPDFYNMPYFTYVQRRVLVCRFFSIWKASSCQLESRLNGAETKDKLEIFPHLPVDSFSPSHSPLTRVSIWETFFANNNDKASGVVCNLSQSNQHYSPAHKAICQWSTYIVQFFLFRFYNNPTLIFWVTGICACFGNFAHFFRIGPPLHVWVVELQTMYIRTHTFSK
jgi:hypothetical protein